MLPEKIGHYEIKSELGRGGMATVYHGYDPRFEREVAIKVLPPELLHADPNFRLRFEREAKIIAQLEHPSIVPVYDVGEDNHQPYFVMRYMRGGSLSDRIKAGVLSLEDALKILEQIAPGLDEAHAKGIVHRDLKPSNILFDGKGIPYISDFGVAKLVQDSGGGATGSAILGTPAYMAPEQASGNVIDGRADIYALGVMLYEMLTGQQPFHADTPMSLAIKHITEPVPNILEVYPDLPAWVEELISSTMAKNPNDRFQTAQEMVDSFRAHLNEGMVATQKKKKPAPIRRPTPDSKTVMVKKKRRINPWVVIVPLLILFMALVGGGLLASGWLRVSLLDIPSPLPDFPTFTLTSQPLPTPTQHMASATSTQESTPTSSPTETATPAVPALPIMGGADKIAFLGGNDIWIMNVDGSDLQRLTTDGAKKFNLEWLPDGTTILYIAGMTLKTVDIETQREEIVTGFISSAYFESFHVSPDGKQAAISLDRELFVVPFDLERLKNVRGRSDLLDMKGCLFYDAYAVKDAIWSNDGQKLALKILVTSGNQRADAIRILDIQKCGEEDPKVLDDFPTGRFPFKNTIVDYDWDGDLLFFFNSDVFKGGFGELVFYNTFTHKFDKIFPIENNCCYRDATFSPDGMYVIFAFQDIRLGEASTVRLYYVRVDALTTGGVLQPIPMPDGFFALRDEAPMPVLRPELR
jgi:serine/threonine protein kinase